MAIKNYMINDKWLDIAKQNIVEVKSTDGVIGSVKVNGQEYGGGGGSSDFSTAEVEFKNQTTSMLTIKTVNINNDELIGEILLGDTVTATKTLVLYKGSQEIEIPFGVESVTASGDITVDDEEGVIIINGSGTVVFQS